MKSRGDAKARIRALLDDDARPASGPVEARHFALDVQRMAREVGDPLLEAEGVLLLGRHRLAMLHPLQALARLEWAHRIFAVNQRPDRDAACEALRARALLDLGLDVQAVRAADTVLREPAAATFDRAHAELVKSLALGRLGRFDEAVAVASAGGVPRARASGEPRLIAHALSVHAIGLIFDLFARKLPEVWIGGMAGLDQRLSMELPDVTRVARLLDEADEVLASSGPWRYLKGLRHFFVGLVGEPSQADQAVAALTDLAALQLQPDPPQAAWLLIYRGYVQQRQGALRRAVLSMTQAAALAESAGLPSQMRQAHNHLARLHEATGDPARALESHKRFSELLVLSVLDADVVPGDTPRGPIAVWPSRRSDAADEIRPRMPSSIAGALASSHVRRALERVDAWMKGKLSVSDVTKASGVSRRTLEMAMKDFCNVTVSELIRRRGLTRAALALERTTASVAEIARIAGYRSPAAFAQAFRGQYGSSPSNWRRERARQASADAARLDARTG